MNDIPIIWIVLAAVVAAVFFARVFGNRPRTSKRGLGVDIDDDLLRACRGDRAMAERLVQHELARKPELSRPSAVLLALSRLRDDKR